MTRKIICVVVAVILLAASFCGGYICKVKNEKNNTIQLVFKKYNGSSFIDFSVDESVEKVYFDCYLVIENNYCTKQTVKLVGLLLAEKENGLLKDSAVYMYDEDGKEETLILPPESVTTMKATFVGDWGGKYQKNDRSLFPIHILVYPEDKMAYEVY